MRNSPPWTYKSDQGEVRTLTRRNISTPTKSKPVKRMKDNLINNSRIK